VITRKKSLDPNPEKESFKQLKKGMSFKSKIKMIIQSRSNRGKFGAKAFREAENKPSQDVPQQR
jgi:hypothetical protein